MDTARKRSVVWGFFTSVDPQSVQCLLCGSYLLKHVQGSTTSMLRHLRVKHPTVDCRKGNGLVVETIDNNDHQETDGEQFCSVVVALEDGESDITTTTMNEPDVRTAMNGIQETSQGGPTEQITHAEASDDRPVKHIRHRRSLIWRHFKRLDGLDAARCLICMKKMQCCESGGTSNLRRHMSKRHPKEFTELVSNGQHPPPLNLPQDSIAETDETVWVSQHRSVPVVEALEDGESDTTTTVNEPDVSTAMNGIQETSQGGPTEQITHAEASDDRPVKHIRHRRSLIWRHFERLDGLDAARCLICMKKIQCCESSGTSNLRRHMSKRHPKAFSELVSNGQHPPPLNLPQDSIAETDETVWVSQHRSVPGALKVSRATEGNSRVFRRERELIEALRRTQKEEARTLEHQRELLEKLRVANAREAAAERENIESLRKAQQEEAKDLNRQREELQKEKAELQKKWEELQQERQELVTDFSFSVNALGPIETEDNVKV